MTKGLDGWDLGILIRLNRRESMYKGTYYDLSLINSELISEVGWLKDGKKELLVRLMNLYEQGYVDLQIDSFYDLIPQFKFVKFPEGYGVQK